MRRDPGATVTAELDWIGTRVIERLAPGDARGATQRFRRALYRGRRVHCPVCDGRFRFFKPAWNRPDAICPACMSQERHRALALYLRAHPRVLDVGSLLHFAPEPGLARLVRDAGVPGYVSADLRSPEAMDHVDIQALPYASGSFDAIICSHVLEHVPDDRRAMRELARVLRPGGWALVMVPVDLGRSSTLEDPAIATAHERRASYRQEDHLRLYGRDLPERLDAEGFRTDVVRFVRDLGESDRRRHGLNPDDELYFARRTLRGAEADEAVVPGGYAPAGGKGRP